MIYEQFNDTRVAPKIHIHTSVAVPVLSLPLDEEPFLLTEEDEVCEVNVQEGMEFLASIEPRLDVYPATPTMTAVDAFEAVEAARKIVGDIGVVTYLRYRRRAERAMGGVR